MAVIVKYVVVRNGKEDMIFATKKEADAYDKMLDVAERLYDYLQHAALDIPEEKLDALAFFMAQHRDPIGRLLKGGMLEATATGGPATVVEEQDTASRSSAGNDSQTSKRPRATKPKAAA